MTLTIKRDGNWSSFQLANSALPLSVTSSAIAPSARMHNRGPQRGQQSKGWWRKGLVWLFASCIKQALCSSCLVCLQSLGGPFSASQRSLHNEPIFRLLLKVAVKGTQQCDFLNFCGVYSPITCMTSFCTAICMYLHLLCEILCKTIAVLLCTLLSQSSCTTCNCEQKSEM